MNMRLATGLAEPDVEASTSCYSSRSLGTMRFSGVNPALSE